MAVRFKAKKRTYLDPEKRTTYTVWHPRIKFEGEWCYISDKTTRSTLAEAPDEEAAIKMAIAALDKIPPKVDIGTTE